MTHDNSTGGTALVNPAPSSGLKHSLRSATRATRASTRAEEERRLEATLIHEEDKVLGDLEDEEVTSVEDNDDVAVENTMLTVALVQSVVEQKTAPGGADEGKMETDSPKDDESKHQRYGLRKRRRPTGQDLERLEHNQSSTEGGLARVAKRVDVTPQRELKTTETRPIPEPVAKPVPPEPVLPEPLPEASMSEATIPKPVPESEISGPPIQNPLLSEPSLPDITIPATAIPDITIPATAMPAPAIPDPTISAPASASAAPVPAVKIETRPKLDSVSVTRLEGARPSIVPSSVPNPLSVLIDLPQPEVVIPPPQDKTLKEDVTAKVGNPFAVPCPLPASSVAADKPEIAVPDSTEKRKVTINEPEGRRSRGFSIDVDLNIDFDDSSASAAQPGEKRDRAFSFECFAFGINADEPLPPLEPNASSSHVASIDDRMPNGRPRGDSIIFDPSSFQDGGIHEKHALESRRSDSVDLPGGADAKANPPTPDPGPASSSSATAAPDAKLLVSSEAAAVVSLTTTAAGTTTATVNMQLVNKDGRIGIYLPEARRARIARFHSKRAQRIWKKRIKYDCRKKLADSRPRIKGRFVKRSDMDED